MRVVALWDLLMFGCHVHGYVSYLAPFYTSVAKRMNCCFSWLALAAVLGKDSQSKDAWRAVHTTQLWVLSDADFKGR